MFYMMLLCMITEWAREADEKQYSKRGNIVSKKKLSDYWDGCLFPEAEQ